MNETSKERIEKFSEIDYAGKLLVSLSKKVKLALSMKEKNTLIRF